MFLLVNDACISLKTLVVCLFANRNLGSGLLRTEEGLSSRWLRWNPTAEQIFGVSSCYPELKLSIVGRCHVWRLLTLIHLVESVNNIWDSCMRRANVVLSFDEGIIRGAYVLSGFVFWRSIQLIKIH